MAILEDVSDTIRCMIAAKDKAKLGVNYGAMRCPKCNKMVHWQAETNGHTSGMCETRDCVRWIE